VGVGAVGPDGLMCLLWFMEDSPPVESLFFLSLISSDLFVIGLFMKTKGRRRGRVKIVGKWIGAKENNLRLPG